MSLLLLITKNNLISKFINNEFLIKYIVEMHQKYVCKNNC